MKWPNNHGFTIVELMIATSIFSIILLLCATSLVTIGKIYHKGLISSKTQEAARVIMEDLASQVQFSGGKPSSLTSGIYSGLSVNSFCIRDTRYTYAIDAQVDDNGLNAALHKSPHALWRDTTNNPIVCPQADLTTSDPDAAASTNHGIANSGREMVSAGMRLRTLSVKNTQGNLWKIDVGLVYGDDATLTRKPLPSPNDTITGCAGTNDGGNFCAISDLSTEVYRSIQ